MVAELEEEGGGEGVVGRFLLLRVSASLARLVVVFDLQVSFHLRSVLVVSWGEETDRERQSKNASFDSLIAPSPFVAASCAPSRVRKSWSSSTRASPARPVSSLRKCLSVSPRRATPDSRCGTVSTLRQHSVHPPERLGGRGVVAGSAKEEAKENCGKRKADESTTTTPGVSAIADRRSARSSLVARTEKHLTSTSTCYPQAPPLPALPATSTFTRSVSAETLTRAPPGPPARPTSARKPSSSLPPSPLSHHSTTLRTSTTPLDGSGHLTSAEDTTDYQLAGWEECCGRRRRAEWTLEGEPLSKLIQRVEVRREAFKGCAGVYEGLSVAHCGQNALSSGVHFVLRSPTSQQSRSLSPSKTRTDRLDLSQWRPRHTLAAIVAIFLLYLFLRRTSSSHIPFHYPLPLPTGNTTFAPTPDRAIPPYVHYVFGLSPTFGNKPFDFIHFICLTSALVILKPEVIYMHYVYEPNTWYWRRFVWDVEQSGTTRLEMVKERDVTDVFGKPIEHFAHKADVLRLEALRDYGGVYLDVDVLVIKGAFCLFSSLDNCFEVEGE